MSGQATFGKIALCQLNSELQQQVGKRNAALAEFTLNGSAGDTQRRGAAGSGSQGLIAYSLRQRVRRLNAPSIITTTAAGALFRNAVLQDAFMLSFDYCHVRTAERNEE